MTKEYKKWTKESGEKPCESCFDDWEEYSENENMIGTVMYAECGDGCCWNRRPCEECGGTGIDGYLK